MRGRRRSGSGPVWVVRPWEQHPESCENMGPNREGLGNSAKTTSPQFQMSYLVNGTWDEARNVPFSIEDEGKTSRETWRSLDGWEVDFSDAV